jgi:hypothetical protein
LFVGNGDSGLKKREELRRRRTETAKLGEPESYTPEQLDEESMYVAFGALSRRGPDTARRVWVQLWLPRIQYLLGGFPFAGSADSTSTRKARSGKSKTFANPAKVSRPLSNRRGQVDSSSLSLGVA